MAEEFSKVLNCYLKGFWGQYEVGLADRRGKGHVLVLRQIEPIAQEHVAGTMRITRTWAG